MANIVLAIVAVIFSILVVVGSVYFLIYFQDPEDKWVAWLPKVVVVTGLSIACYNVLLLPLDVANQNGNALNTAGLPMKQLDLAFFLLTIIYVAVVIPFVILYYESWEDTAESKKNTALHQLLHALKWITPIVVVLVVVVAVLYIFIGHALLPVTHIYGTFQENVTDAFATYCPDSQTVGRSLIKCFTSVFEERVKVSVPVYIIGIASCLGWILFSVFGGIGLCALPIDSYLKFKHRPRKLKLAEYTEKKKEIGDIATSLYRQYQEDFGSKQDGSSAAKKQSFIGSKLLKKKENSFKRVIDA
jgi:LMBR1 domain-containing protein 1